MRDVAITAIGKDRPGIVAAVTEVLFELGCNLADCSMSLLGDQFAMILLVEVPEEIEDAAIREGLGVPAEQLDLVIEVSPAGAGAQPTESSPHVISVYGPDRPGIVHGMSKTLAEHEVNITNLVSHITGKGIYTTVLDVDVPAGLDPDELEAALAAAAQALGVDVSIRPRETSAL